MKLGKLRSKIIWKRTLLIFGCIAIGWFLKARITPQNPMVAAGANADPYVLVETITEQDITPFQSVIGHVEAINSVSLQPQVSGYLEKITFTEGSLVKEGDVLFVIEKERYQATADLRKAELDSARANLTKIEKDYHRQKSLNKQKYASEAKLDESYSSLLQAQAAIKQAEANYELAKIDLNHAEIKAPFSGRIGKAKVTEGNYVSPSTGILASVVQFNPIRINFSLTDKQITDVIQGVLKNDSVDARIELPNGKIIRKKSVKEFMENSIDTNTATVAVYAEFENNEGVLIPGSYVNLEIDTGAPQKVLTINQAAIGQDDHGNYAMTVTKDGIVQQHRIELGEVVGKRQIVKSGLQAGDDVIIQGLQKVADGRKVRAEKIKTEEK